MQKYQVGDSVCIYIYESSFTAAGAFSSCRKLGMARVGTTSTLAVAIVAITVICAASSTTQGRNSLIYVASVPYQCPNISEPCHTLAYYLANVSYYFGSNTTFVFLPGDHNLTTAVRIVNVSNQALIGKVALHVQSPSRIVCGGAVGGFSFTNITNLTIKSLTVFGCGRITTGCGNYATLSFATIIDLTVSGVTVLNSTGYGFCGDNVLGNSYINASTFAFSSAFEHYPAGNMRFYYKNCPQDTLSYLYIGFSQFLHGYSDTRKSYASGLAMTIIECSTIIIDIDNSYFSHNKANNGGNLAISFHNTSHYYKSPVIVRNCYIGDGSGYRGGGMHVTAIEDSHQSQLECNPIPLLLITNTDFAWNYAWGIGGGLYMTHSESEAMFCSPRQITIESCNFYHNAKGYHSYPGGVAVHVSTFHVASYVPHVLPQAQFRFENCTFNQNHDAAYDGMSGAVFIVAESSVTFIDSEFVENECTAMVAVSSSILLQGNISITGNSATNGGGLLLCERSLVYFQPNTTVIFAHNYATKFGGAIYAEDECLQSVPTCFFQPSREIALQPSKLLDTVHVFLEDNWAGYAGTALYGGSVDFCYFVEVTDYQYTNSSWVFHLVFNITHSPLDMSSVSSAPQGVCFCFNSSKVCGTKNLELSALPGKTFTVSAIVVGQMNGAVPGDVTATFVHNTHGNSLKASEYVQTINGTVCFQLNFTVFSKQSSVNLSLIPQQKAYTKYNFKPPWIDINLLRCPLGFSLTTEQPHCDCVQTLAQNQVNCNISDSVIHRQAPAWIGYHFASSTCSKEGIVFHSHCPFDYCKFHSIDIKTTNETFDEDVQCAFRRMGILCGECKNGLSLTFGGSECNECSDMYILLLIVFAVAGILLVLLILAFNLTVTEGTINGLVFYANIIQMNSATFFPIVPQNLVLRVFAYLLMGFISWLNLDLGIQLCFYNGMNTIVKTWLQFSFPIYIWLLVGLIVAMSRRYAIFARLMGRNAVKVLGTLFLLSYAKLLRTIISAVSFARLEYPNGSKFTVWLYNGNVPYLHGEHIPLFLVAVLFGFLSLPYALILFLFQWMQRKSEMKLLKWIEKLKPLFDAYTGPYKDKYRFWTGLLLLVRILLFVVNAVNVFGEPDLNLVAVMGASLLLLAFAWIGSGGPYRLLPLNILESSFFLNLGFLTIATIFARNHDVQQMAITFTSVSMALIIFIGILFYHTRKLVSSISASFRTQHHQATVLQPVPPEHDNPQGDPPSDLPENIAQTARYRRVVHIRFDQYREPLLEYEDANHS